jgi:hypothetical protein
MFSDFSNLPTTSSKFRPKSIRIYKKRAIHSDYGDLHLFRKQEDPNQVLQIRSPLNDIQIKDLVHIKTLNKSIQNSLNPTPTNEKVTKRQKDSLFNSESISEENSPLFYPQEPRIHTSSGIKKRSNTPKLPSYLKLTRVDWVYKFSKRQKWQNLSKELKFDPLGSGLRLEKAKIKGKVYKGICEYPNLIPSPVRLQNIKLSS